jgi:uncharacterized protein (TIGR02145 family)
MNRFLKIASIVTMLCFVWGLAAPVSGRSREGSHESAQMEGSGRDSVTNDLSASDSGVSEKPGEKKERKKFPWLLAGLGTAVVITAILLLTGKKKSSTDGNNIVYGTVTDIDGNVYRTVRIGSQEWMAENLKTTSYRNGDAIANVSDNNSWFNLTTGAYCNYNNDENYVATYGRFYNWYAVNDGRNLAPAGWHVSTDADWAALITYLGGEAVAGGYLKEAGTTHWSSPNTGATNESGFTALPGGYRNPDGPSNHIGNIGFWWTATVDNTNKAWRLTMRYFDIAVERNSYYMMGGMSVRCVKD